MLRVAALLLVTCATLHAGMPSITLSDLGKFRLQSLSFFLLALFILSWLVWRLWNGLTKDFTRLPKLRYRGALGLTVLWGLLVLVVLTMISGARELLSPKAWVKTGLTYGLAGDEATNAKLRAGALEDLRNALWHWADTHNGVLPIHEFGDELPERRWQVPATDASRYRFDPLVPRDSKRLLAWEPEGLPLPRWVLRGDGTVEKLDEATITSLLSGEAP
jgi:hypothetical protein